MTDLECSLAEMRQRCNNCVETSKECSEICLEAERKFERYYKLNSVDDRDAVFKMIYPQND